MREMIEITLKITLVIFMVGNLLCMGLKLQIAEALTGIRNVRFVTYSLLWGFVMCPAIAWLLCKIIPLDAPYAMGLLLLGMVPCAPFLPPMVERARGDMGYAAAFMLLASVVTIIFMPIAVPLMVRSLTANPWTIARPLVFLVLVPLLVGLLVQSRLPRAAGKMYPAIKTITGIDTIIMLLSCVVIYGKGFLGAVGSYAIGAQLLFFTAAIVGPYVLSIGLARQQRSVLSLGVATRNIGAAFAPLLTARDVDQRAIVMVALGVVMQASFSFAAATWFGRSGSRAQVASTSPIENVRNYPRPHVPERIQTHF